jgi:hypothetical protein
MRAKTIVLTLLVAGVFLVPTTMAQAPGEAYRVTNCKPENCDPLAANGGQVQTGDAVVKTILYGHFEDILQSAPLNTQAPHPEKEVDQNKGFLMPTIDTNTACEQCNLHFKNNQFEMFSSPGLVEYTAEGWRIHQEPGLAETVQIAGDTMHLYWYLSAHNVPNAPTGQPAGFGTVASIGVYARMETGRFSGYGELIAEGDTGTGYGSPQPSTDPNTYPITMYNAPGEDAVYEFEVPMRVINPTIPSAASSQGYVVTVVPYQVKQGEEAEFTQAEWRVRTGAKFPPRIVVDVANPMVTKHTLVHTYDDQLFFRWSFVSPWGSYDLDPASLEIQVDGPKQLTGADIEFIKLKHSIDHDGHFKPVNASWRYPYVANPLPPGEYTVKASVHSLQHTYLLEWSETFTVDERGVPQVDSIGNLGGSGGGGAGAKGGAGGDSPGFEVLALVAAVAVGALLIRRRGD